MALGPYFCEVNIKEVAKPRYPLIRPLDSVDMLQEAIGENIAWQISDVVCVIFSNIMILQLNISLYKLIYLFILHFFRLMRMSK